MIFLSPSSHHCSGTHLLHGFPNRNACNVCFLACSIRRCDASIDKSQRIANQIKSSPFGRRYGYDPLFQGWYIRWPTKNTSLIGNLCTQRQTPRMASTEPKTNPFAEMTCTGFENSECLFHSRAPNFLFMLIHTHVPSKFLKNETQKWGKNEEVVKNIILVKDGYVIQIRHPKNTPMLHVLCWKHSQWPPTPTRNVLLYL